MKTDCFNIIKQPVNIKFTGCLFFYTAVLLNSFINAFILPCVVVHFCYSILNDSGKFLLYSVAIGW